MTRSRARLLIALLAFGGCAEGGVFKTPLVRVDLSAHLPRKVRVLAEAAVPLDCSKELALPDGGVSPRFVVAWRVLDFRDRRYIVAVEARPQGDGRVEGVRGLAGSGWVGEPTPASDGTPLRAVTVRVGWSARKGCGDIGRRERLTVRADDPACKKPKGPKLLRPVD